MFDSSCMEENKAPYILCKYTIIKWSLSISFHGITHKTMNFWLAEMGAKGKMMLWIFKERIRALKNVFYLWILKHSVKKDCFLLLILWRQRMDWDQTLRWVFWRGTSHNSWKLNFELPILTAVYHTLWCTISCPKPHEERVICWLKVMTLGSEHWCQCVVLNKLFGFCHLWWCRWWFCRKMWGHRSAPKPCFERTPEPCLELVYFSCQRGLLLESIMKVMGLVSQTCHI